MSELINARDGNRDFRWQLLTTVSALALLAAIYRPSEGKAADQEVDRPTIWIELGGQLEHVSGQGNPFTPGFLAENPSSTVLQSVTPVQAQNPPPFNFGEEGRISFQPEGSDWLFSAGIRIGRSSNYRHVDHQTGRLGKFYQNGLLTFISTKADFADTKARHQESDAILDFSAGKDVGLGLFGRDSSSVFSVGVRLAQFASKSTFDVRARPDVQAKYVTNQTSSGNIGKGPIPHFNTYHATGRTSRSFRGLGPSLSWNGSAPFAGNPQDGEIAFDWGANAALIFGKQRASVQHQESANHFFFSKYSSVYRNPPRGHDTDRAVTVPNVGGFAGASFRYANAKISLGYRADFFFGAIDGGIDTRKAETLGFYGPFASVSVGLGG